MNRIARDMRQGLPNQKYLEFVARYFLQRDVKRQPLFDPFALNVPPDEADAVYVEREDVENEIGQPGTRIILGPEGSGKTTLFRKLPASLHNQPLIVRLPLDQIGTSVPGQDLLEGKISLLTSKILARYVFDAYWEDLLVNHANRATYLPQLRQDQRWMTYLRWFYHHYRPLHHEILEEFELMAWLNASPSSEPFSPNAPEDTLRELICFVTFQQGRYGVPLSQPYMQIQILIDGTERPSNLAITRLIQDAQKLYSLYLDRVQFKLFVDSAWQEQIYAMDCVRQGRVAVYSMPQWHAGELRQILHLRSKDRAAPGEFVEVEYDSEYDWGKFIPTDYLKPAAQTRFVRTIVSEAMKAYEEEDGLDAPIHVLRLARGLVAACAGCWAERGYTPPLSANQISELADLYWKTG